MLGFTVDEIPENERGRVDLKAFEESWAGCRRDHADQPKHLRRVRNRYQSHRRRRPRRRWLFLLRWRQFQRHRGGVGRAIWASTPCTSTCTKPSPRPHGGGGRCVGRCVFRRLWRLSHRCPGSQRGAGMRLSKKLRRAGRSFGRLKAFTGRWACLSARCLHDEPWRQTGCCKASGMPCYRQLPESPA